MRRAAVFGYLVISLVTANALGIGGSIGLDRLDGDIVIGLSGDTNGGLDVKADSSNNDGFNLATADSTGYELQQDGVNGGSNDGVVNGKARDSSSTSNAGGSSSISTSTGPSSSLSASSAAVLSADTLASSDTVELGVEAFLKDIASKFQDSVNVDANSNASQGDSKDADLGQTNTDAISAADSENVGLASTPVSANIDASNLSLGGLEGTAAINGVIETVSNAGNTGDSSVQETVTMLANSGVTVDLDASLAAAMSANQAAIVVDSDAEAGENLGGAALQNAAELGGNVVSSNTNADTGSDSATSAGSITAQGSGSTSGLDGTERIAIISSSVNQGSGLTSGFVGSDGLTNVGSSTYQGSDVTSGFVAPEGRANVKSSTDPNRNGITFPSTPNITGVLGNALGNVNNIVSQALNKSSANSVLQGIHIFGGLFDEINSTRLGDNSSSNENITAATAVSDAEAVENLAGAGLQNIAELGGNIVSSNTNADTGSDTDTSAGSTTAQDSGLTSGLDGTEKIAIVSSSANVKGSTDPNRIGITIPSTPNISGLIGNALANVNSIVSQALNKSSANSILQGIHIFDEIDSAGLGANFSSNSNITAASAGNIEISMDVNMDQAGVQILSPNMSNESSNGQDLSTAQTSLDESSSSRALVDVIENISGSSSLTNDQPTAKLSGSAELEVDSSTVNAGATSNEGSNTDAALDQVDTTAVVSPSSGLLATQTIIDQATDVPSNITALEGIQLIGGLIDIIDAVGLGAASSLNLNSSASTGGNVEADLNENVASTALNEASTGENGQSSATEQAALGAGANVSGSSSTTNSQSSETMSNQLIEGILGGLTAIEGLGAVNAVSNADNGQSLTSEQTSMGATSSAAASDISGSSTTPNSQSSATLANQLLEGILGSLTATSELGAIKTGVSSNEGVGVQSGSNDSGNESNGAAPVENASNDASSSSQATDSSTPAATNNQLISNVFSGLPDRFAVVGFMVSGSSSENTGAATHGDVGLVPAAGDVAANTGSNAGSGTANGGFFEHVGGDGTIVSFPTQTSTSTTTNSSQNSNGAADANEADSSTANTETSSNEGTATENDLGSGDVDVNTESMDSRLIENVLGLASSSVGALAGDDGAGSSAVSTEASTSSGIVVDKGLGSGDVGVNTATNDSQNERVENTSSNTQLIESSAEPGTDIEAGSSSNSEEASAEVATKIPAGNTESGSVDSSIQIDVPLVSENVGEKDHVVEFIASRSASVDTASEAAADLNDLVDPLSGLMSLAKSFAPATTNAHLVSDIIGSLKGPVGIDGAIETGLNAALLKESPANGVEQILEHADSESNANDDINNGPTGETTDAESSGTIESEITGTFTTPEQNSAAATTNTHSNEENAADSKHLTVSSVGTEALGGQAVLSGLGLGTILKLSEANFDKKGGSYGGYAGHGQYGGYGSHDGYGGHDKHGGYGGHGHLHGHGKDHRHWHTHDDDDELSGYGPNTHYGHGHPHDYYHDDDDDDDYVHDYDYKFTKHGHGKNRGYKHSRGDYLYHRPADSYVHVKVVDKGVDPSYLLGK